MKIDVPLEIGDKIWFINPNDNSINSRIIRGVQHSLWNENISTQYVLKEYANIDINKEYFLSEKEAKIELAIRILDSIKDAT